MTVRLSLMDMKSMLEKGSVAVNDVVNRGDGGEPREKRELVCFGITLTLMGLCFSKGVTCIQIQ